MKSRRMLAAAAIAAAVSFIPAAHAQDSNYTPGTVWQISAIDVKPGQFENYMDYLATTWKKMQDYAVKEGMAVSYHVYRVNNPRNGEPDLYLSIESKDYVSTAQREAFRNKLDSMMNSDTRKMDKAFGDREAMRTAVGSMEMQELILK